MYTILADNMLLNIRNDYIFPLTWQGGMLGYTMHFMYTIETKDGEYGKGAQWYRKDGLGNQTGRRKSGSIPFSLL